MFHAEGDRVAYEIHLVKTRKAGTSASCYALIADMGHNYALNFAMEKEHRRSLRFHIHGADARRSDGGYGARYGHVMKRTSGITEAS